MLQDEVPKLQLTVNKHCSSVEEYKNPISTARFSAHAHRDEKRSPTVLRKGFLTSSAAKPARKKEASRPVRCIGNVIKQSKEAQQGPSIPDFLRLPLSDAEQKSLLQKDLLQEVMQPDEATLSKILGDSSLLEGFQDPTVMEAVAEIAQDPDAFKKYAANTKVSKFYKGMESILGPKMQRAAATVQEGAKARA